jgi:hypothetical protein
MSKGRVAERAHVAMLFPDLPPMAPDKVDPPAKVLRKAGHKRRLLEALQSATPFVEPTIPCYHGRCRVLFGDGCHGEGKPPWGMGGRRWCPACPGHKRLRGGGVLCDHDE